MAKATVCIVFMLILMMRLTTDLMDINSAFLNGTFDPVVKVHIGVPKGFSRWYGEDMVLLLLKTLYGLKIVQLQFGGPF